MRQGAGSRGAGRQGGQEAGVQGAGRQGGQGGIIEQISPKSSPSSLSTLSLFHAPCPMTNDK
ncbi:hypothetical protein NSTC731_02104 [Nostoc sp. DSM 114167]|jgi:hypothetical protein